MDNGIKTYLSAGHIISSLGFTTEEHMEHLLNGESGIHRHTNEQISQSPFMGGLIDRERWGKVVAEYGLESHTQLEQLFIYSLHQVIDKSGINPAECGLILSTTKGNIDLLPEKDENVYLDLLGKNIAGTLGITHIPIVISTACISGVSALIVASRLIKAGKYKHILVAGGDLLTKFVLSGFESFKSVSPGICRPYDIDRDGLTLGEGCGALLMTCDRKYVTEETAIILEGGTITNDANHISGPSRTGDGLYYAISQTMKQAGIDNTTISFVNTHGTGTPYNDEMESKAVRWSELQDKPIHSLKSSIGHTLGASGIIETIICMEHLRIGQIAGTYGYKENGVSTPLKVSAEKQTFTGGRCIKTASGFGGCNAAISLALESYSTTPKEITLSPIHQREICIIRNNCIWVNGTILFEEIPELSFGDFIRSAYKYLRIEDRKFYKMDDLCKLGYIAAQVVMDRVDRTLYQSQEIGVILSNRSASLDTDQKHQQIMDKTRENETSPAIFVYTLPNVVLGELCIKYKIQGENTFFITEKYDEEFMKEYIRLAMQQQEMQACITGWCELLNNQYEARFEWWER